MRTPEEIFESVADLLAPCCDDDAYREEFAVSRRHEAQEISDRFTRELEKLSAPPLPAVSAEGGVRADPASITPESEFLSAIREALTRKAEAILHEEAEEAVKRARSRIQEHVGSVVTGILNQYRITMRGDALEIIVKIEHLPAGKS